MYIQKNICIKKILICIFCFTMILGSASCNSPSMQSTTQSTTVGNSFSNINNVGIAAIQGNWIYYSNGSIYKIKTDGSGKQKLNNATNSQLFYINVVDNRIYYVNWSNGNDSDTNHLYSMNTDGSDNKQIGKNYVGSIYVVGDRIFYINWHDNGCLYSMKIDGNDNKKLSNDSMVCIVNVANNRIYYETGDGKNYFTYSMKTDGSDKKQLCNERAVDINVAKNLIYYSSQNNDYICSMKTDGSDKKQLNSIWSNSIIIDGDFIYYASLGDTAGIYRMKTDGSDNKKISNDTTICMNVVGNQIYYRQGIGIGGNYYSMKTDGSDVRATDQ